VQALPEHERASIFCQSRRFSIIETHTVKNSGEDTHEERTTGDADTDVGDSGVVYKELPRDCIDMKSVVFSTEGHVLLTEGSFRHFSSSTSTHDGSSSSSSTAKKKTHRGMSYPQCSAYHEIHHSS
jgi:hypothetical protein